MCTIPYSSTNVHNARCGQEAHVIGFMHRTNWQNTGYNGPVRVYEFWIVPKQYSSESSFTDAQLQDDFFTRHGLALDKDGSWTDNLPSILYDEPVNSDKFLVLKKKTFLLGTCNMASATQNTGSITAYRQHKTFIKLNRKFTYGDITADGETSSVCLQPPVFYINFVIPQMQATGTPSPGLINREAHIVTYFRDGESGM